MRSVINKSSLLAMALCSSLTVLSFNYAHAVDPAGIAEVTVGTGFIDVQVHTEFDHAVLRVAGPDGYAANLQVWGGSQFLTADLLLDAEDNIMNQRSNSSAPERWHALPDGVFSYEIVLFDFNGSSQTVTGSFRVEAGQVVDFRPTQADDGADSKASEEDRLGALDQPGLLQRAFGSLLNILIPSAHAQPGDFDNFVSIRSLSGTGTTRLNLNATDSITVTSDTWRLMNDINSKTFRIVQGTGSDVRFLVNQNGNVGIGTTAPLAALHVTGFNTLRLNDFRWTVDSDSAFFRGPSGQSPFQVMDAPNGSLSIAENGNVGVGIDGFTGANASLHVRRSDGSAQVLVEENSSSSGDLLTLKANDAVKFRMLTNGGADSWAFRTTGGGNQFAIASPEATGIAFRLTKTGNATFLGNVTANGVLLTSTREAKTDFAPLDVHEVLDRLSSLEISQWRYKHEDEGTKHYGPIAEEFHEAFGLSDGKSLNMIDTNGIAFAAIKALDQQNKELQAENQHLLQRLERLEKAIDI